MQKPEEKLFPLMSAVDEPHSAGGDDLAQNDMARDLHGGDSAVPHHKVFSSGETLRLLVVDDDAIDRMAILRALRGWSGELIVEEAVTGNEALELMAHKQFDAVLLDYRLPDIDGLEILRIINMRRRGSMAVLVLTGLDNEDVGIRCIEAGAQDYLLKKDVSSRHLFRAVAHARMRHNIEMELLRSHERVRDLSERDSLTGLYNRSVFDKSLRESVPRAVRLNYHLALLLLDLDNFKLINDSHGHELGDELLRGIGERLEAEIRAGDLLCRIGGDEFAVLASCGEDSQSIHIFAKRLTEVLAEPVVIDEIVLSPTVSIGIALAPENARDADEFLKCADLAMYRAKRGGRNCIHFYADELQQQVMRHVQTERDIRSALSNDEFSAFYQPQFSSVDGGIVGVEALLRWRHPTRGLLAPAEFLDVAEDTGLIVQIDNMIMEKACADFMRGPMRASGMRVSVNLSARQLCSADIYQHICRVLENTGMLPQRLVVEITESMLIENMEASQGNLQAIANLGISVALDDFGTGYSSLSYLKQLPISILKVDRSFLINVPEETKDTQMLSALVSMAHQLNYDVVVEGVETEVQAVKCRELGVELLQGFHFARPMPLQDLCNKIDSEIDNEID